jgi:hypothetical protein
MAYLTWIAQTVISRMIAPLLQLDNPKCCALVDTDKRAHLDLAD